MYEDHVPARFFINCGAYTVGAISVSERPALVPILYGFDEVPFPVVWVLTLHAKSVFEETTTDPKKSDLRPGGESGVKYRRLPPGGIGVGSG
jgi:hypothetical protein